MLSKSTDTAGGAEQLVGWRALIAAIGLYEPKRAKSMPIELMQYLNDWTERIRRRK